MNINKNKIIKLAVIVMSAVALIAMSPLFAEANNYRDDPWSFTVGEYGNTGFIVKNGRDKTDATSVYIKCEEATADKSFLATAYGSKSPSTGFINCIYNGNSSKSYAVTKNSTFFMVNYIYEAGYYYANVYYNAAYVKNVTYSGVWSPDSIN